MSKGYLCHWSENQIGFDYNQLQPDPDSHELMRNRLNFLIIDCKNAKVVIDLNGKKVSATQRVVRLS